MKGYKWCDKYDKHWGYKYELKTEAINKKSSFERIYEVVRQIPAGKVATYGQIASLAGNKRWAPVLGYALHANPPPDHNPCYRGVNRTGQVSPAFALGGRNRQIEFLEADGVPCPDGIVDLAKYQWKRFSLTDFQ